MTADRVVIVGDGVAGMTAALTVRSQQPDWRITVLSDDPQPYYYRAALTNYLLGEVADDELWALPPSAWDDLRLERVLGRAEGLDPADARLRLAGGGTLAYDRLLIASGARARALATPEQAPAQGLPGAELAGVVTLRTLQDVQALLALLPATRQAVVLGGGILGLEVAEGLHARNIAVSLVHRGPTLLDRVVDRRAGELIRLLMTRAGVAVYTGQGLAAIEGRNGRVCGVRLGDGQPLPGQLVVACIGTEPASDWLAASGIALARGLLPVDRYQRVAGVEGIWAAGDAALVDESDQPWPNPGGLWQPAQYQGRVAGLNLAAPANQPKAEYRPGILLNATRAWGFSLDSAGCHPDAADASIEYDDLQNGRPVYKRALFRAGELAGFVLLGDRREAQALTRLLNLRDATGAQATLGERIFDPAFDLFAWVGAQERASQAGRWRDTALLHGTPVVGRLRARHDAARRLTLKAPVPAALTQPETVAALPLTLDDGRAAHTLTRGPATLGDVPQALIRLTGHCPPGSSLVLEPSGRAWLAHSGSADHPALLNGQPLLQPSFVNDLDVLALGRWKAIVRLAQAATEPAGTDAAATPVVPVLRDALQRFQLAPGRTSRIGGSDDNDLVLPDADFFHAQIQYRDAAYFIVDAGSRAGVWVDDERLAAPRRLAGGERIALGQHGFHFELAETEPDGQADEATAAPGPAAAYLICEQGPLAPRALALALPALIGRDRQAAPRLPDPLLSRLHARIEYDGAVFRITDLGSLNGTRLGPNRLEPQRAQRLSDGDLLQLGQGRYRFRTELPTDRVLASVERLTGTAVPRGATEWLSTRQPAADRGEAPESTALLLQPEGELLQSHIDTVRLAGGGPFILGRRTAAGAAQADGERIELDLPLISRRHVRVDYRAGRFWLTDLGSRLGTRLNGQPVTGEPQPLAPGDTVVLADVYGFRLALEATAVEPEPPAPPAGVRLVPADELLAREAATLTFAGRGPFIIGRDPGVSHPLALPMLSRHHAELRGMDSGYELRDLGSKLGTRVDGHAIGAGFGAVDDGARVEFGPYRFRFDATPEQPQVAQPAGRRRGLRIDWLPGSDPLEADLQRLVAQELDACIGCHACLRACPLPEAGTVTIAALNNLAQQLGHASPTVEDFVQHCTQCHACVPVCPVNIQRSRIVLWNKLKAAPASAAPVIAQCGEAAQPLALTVADVAATLAAHPLLGELTEAERLQLLGQSRFRRLADGETLLAAEQYPDALWLILDGQLELGLATAGQDFVRSVTLAAGQTVAEYALLADRPLEVTVRGHGDALVVGLARYSLQYFGRINPAFAAALEAAYVDRSLRSVLERDPALETLSGDPLDRLVAGLVVDRFAPGMVVAEAAEAPLAMVTRGFVRELRCRDGETVTGNYLKPGGRLSAALDSPLGKLLRWEALTVAEVARLPAGVADQLAPEALQRFRGDKPDVSGDSALPVQAAGIEQVIHARELMVIDTRRCVDCDNCVDACARRHGHSRLDRRGRGFQIGPVQIPGSCYHCADPRCLLCAVDGIVREPNGEIRIVADNCIGCGACAERCPYDNIQMVAREPGNTRRWLDRLPVRWRSLLGQAAEPGALPDYARLAVKCDLCAGYADGPACVRSCPTGAAQRVDPVRFFAGRETTG